MVQTFAANGTDQPFHVGILPGRSGRAPHFFRPHAFRHDGEVLTVDRISIAPQISGYLVPGKPSRICCMVHSWVGCSVTWKCTTRRRSCDRTTKTNSTRKVAVGTVKKSIEAICPT